MFFDQYKSLCLSIGKKPNTVAKELGIASSSITQWKHGSTPRAQLLQKIADYFDVSVSYLIEESDQKEKPATHEGDELSDFDMALLERFRKLTKENRELALDQVDLLLKRQDKK